MKKKEKEESVKEAQKLENNLCVKPNRRREEEEGRTNLIGVSFYPYSHLQCNKKKKSNSYNEKVYS